MIPHPPTETVAQMADRHEAEALASHSWEATQPKRVANLRSGGRPDVQPRDVWATCYPGYELLVPVTILKSLPHRRWRVRNDVSLERCDIDERRLRIRLRRV